MFPFSNDQRIKNQLYGLDKSPHRSTPEKTPSSIIKPPMVGVPIFLTMRNYINSKLKSVTKQTKNVIF